MEGVGPFSFSSTIAKVRAAWSASSPNETKIPTPRKFTVVKGYPDNSQKMYTFTGHGTAMPGTGGKTWKDRK